MFYKKLWKNKKVLDVQDVGCTKNSTHSFIIETLVQIFYNGPTQCVICNGVLLPAPPSCFLHPFWNVFLTFWIGHSFQKSKSITISEAEKEIKNSNLEVQKTIAFIIYNMRGFRLLGPCKLSHDHRLKYICDF